ncbi:MAG: hypothetical protein FJW36_10815 [Acidobacteria bacterium]|nr:hypothetical protein [Acidobacteriota bacterium]
MSNDYDLVIIGGGCAGLSLASRISELGNSSPRTLVLDSRSNYSNDRTWCFWNLPSSQASHLARYQWSKFRVATEHQEIIVNCSDYAYCAVPGDDFYRHSLTTIGKNPQLTIQSGCPVLGSVQRAGDRWEIETPETIFTANNVVDTRPVKAPQVGGAILWQTFIGAEIEVDAELFAAGQVTLMDFEQSPLGRIVFTYVLPFTANRALVEVTEFSPTLLQPSQLQDFLTLAIKDITQGGEYRCLRNESGVLPMGQTPLPQSLSPGHAVGSSFVRAGVAHGGARPCTGYAFQRIQCWATQCAVSLVEKGYPVAHRKDGYAIAFLDHLFLRVLKDEPNLGPNLFTQLFGSAPTPSVLRFLGDCATPADILQVISALPPSPFIRALLDLCRRPGVAWRELLAS